MQWWSHCVGNFSYYTLSSVTMTIFIVWINRPLTHFSLFFKNVPCTSLCTTVVPFPFFLIHQTLLLSPCTSCHYLYQSIDIFLTPFSEFLPSFISAFTQPIPLLSTLSLQYSTWQCSQRCRSAIVPLQTPEPHLKLTWAHKAMRSPKSLMRCGQKIVCSITTDACSVTVSEARSYI